MKLYTKLKMSAAIVGVFSAAAMMVPVQADIQHLDDTIITFSLCVGNDCVNGENFGFDTVRLKENNLRIHFDDTSSSASFPSNDWRITVNDSNNGGASYFSIEDATAGRRPFTVEAGAAANSLYVETDGDVGLGTSNPAVELHIVDGDSPTIRLEQNGSSGFTPQTYDVASNEANFFIRDVTNGSRLFFRSKPGAPENSLFIDAQGKIGLGTDAPDSNLHIRGQQVRLENSGPVAAFRLDESGSTFGAGLQLQSDNLFLAFDDSTMPEFRIDTGGNVTLEGTITTSGSTCGSGCDAVFDPDYDLETIEEHANEMFSNKFLPNVGPTEENKPINLTDKLGRMLNELEKAHIYIAQLDDEKKVLQARLEAQEARLEKLESLVSK